MEASGESFFAVLHEPHQLRGEVGDYYAESTDGDQAGTSRDCNTVLNSLGPIHHLRRLSGPSRSLLKKYFETNPPVNLSTDHTTVAFSEDQVYNLIRVACHETAHAFFDMMNGLLHRASRLSRTSGPQTRRMTTGTSSNFRAATPMPSSTGSSDGSDRCPQTSDPESYTSGAVHTGDSDVSFQSTVGVGDLSAPLLASSPETWTRLSPGTSGSSQDKTTLATLRKEALDEHSHNQSGVKSIRTVGVSDPLPRVPE